MKVLRADGRLTDVSRLRAHPAAGLDMPRRITSGLDIVELARLPTGERQTATFYAIYESNPWLYAAVNHISSSLSRIPLKLYELLDAEGARERIRGDAPTTPGGNTDAQNLDRVLARPEPRHGRAHWIRRMATDFLVAGNGLAARENDGVGRLRFLHHVPWRKVDVQEGEEEPVAFYELRSWRSGKARLLLPEDVVHLSIGNTSDLAVGMSPIKPLRYTIALFNAMQRHLTGFFENQARPSGHIGLEKGTDSKVLELIREQIKQMYTAPESAGKVLVSSGKWETISESPEHSAIVQLMHQSREEVAAAYGVPPPLMGILDRAIMGNVRELRSHDLRAGTGGWAVLVEEEFNAQLIGDAPTLAHHFLEFDMNEALRPDLEALATALRTLQNTFTLNERRKVVNLPKIDHPDADAVWLELNLTPVGEGATNGGAAKRVGNDGSDEDSDESGAMRDLRGRVEELATRPPVVVNLEQPNGHQRRRRLERDDQGRVIAVIEE